MPANKNLPPQLERLPYPQKKHPQKQRNTSVDAGILQRILTSFFDDSRYAQ